MTNAILMKVVMYPKWQCFSLAYRLYIPYTLCTLTTQKCVRGMQPYEAVVGLSNVHSVCLCAAELSRQCSYAMSPPLPPASVTRGLWEGVRGPASERGEGLWRGCLWALEWEVGMRFCEKIDKYFCKQRGINIIDKNYGVLCIYT